MKDKLFDAMFDDLIKKAGTAAILEMENERANEEVPEVEFSKEHEEKMKKFFEEYRKQEAEKKAQNEITTKRYKVRKMVALAAATVVVLALGISTVGAWKGNMLGSYLKNNGEYSDLLNGMPERSLTVENVYFGYVPEGYEFEPTKNGNKMAYIRFGTTDNEQYFCLEIEFDMCNERLNTEDSEIEELVINDKDMIYSENDSLKFLIWFENNNTNTLYANISKEEFIKIAEKIEFLK